mmetsp:Transcript_135766/g.352012  ORF Transcript_135766/g.352012 Transcript_135766/m.352012 type:complete len:480 (-) Transcript_135766:280-1719(-)
MPVATAVPTDDQSVSKNGKDVAEKWPLWKLILMALPQLSVQVLWCFIGPNSASYMRHLGMGASLATLNNIAGPITGFFTGPIVGAVSDSLTSPMGRRRPVIMAGLIATWVAGMLFASSELLLPKSQALYFAAPMYWIMDVTINILQTPHRALAADLAAEDQQLPMQVVFVFMMSIGNFLAFTIMSIYPVPVDHMFELMLGICALNTLCVGIQFLVAKEKPLKPDPRSKRESACAPVCSVVEAVRDSPSLLYHLAAVQCLVWIGNTAWNLYAGQWFGNAVYQGDETATGHKKELYAQGFAAFTFAGRGKAGLQLVSALAIIALLVNTKLRPRFIYAPCIYAGAVVSILAAAVVGHSSTFAIICMIISVMPETGSFAIPFGLVATLNKRAEEEGKQVSTALQMALLNCCVTVGQQICTMVLSGIESKMSLETALPCVFFVAAGAQLLAGTGTLFLDDRPPTEEDSEDTETGNEYSSDDQSD